MTKAAIILADLYAASMRLQDAHQLALEAGARELAAEIDRCGVEVAACVNTLVRVAGEQKAKAAS